MERLTQVNTLYFSCPSHVTRASIHAGELAVRIGNDGVREEHARLPRHVVHVPQLHQLVAAGPPVRRALLDAATDRELDSRSGCSRPPGVIAPNARQAHVHEREVLLSRAHLRQESAQLQGGQGVLREGAVPRSPSGHQRPKLGTQDAARGGVELAAQVPALAEDRDDSGGQRRRVLRWVEAVDPHRVRVLHPHDTASQGALCRGGRSTLVRPGLQEARREDQVVGSSMHADAREGARRSTEVREAQHLRTKHEERDDHHVGTRHQSQRRRPPGRWLHRLHRHSSNVHRPHRGEEDCAHVLRACDAAKVPRGSHHRRKGSSSGEAPGRPGRGKQLTECLTGTARREEEVPGRSRVGEVRDAVRKGGEGDARVQQKHGRQAQEPANIAGYREREPSRTLSDHREPRTGLDGEEGHRGRNRPPSVWPGLHEQRHREDGPAACAWAQETCVQLPEARRKVEE
mmetsp:Transcript_33946/g.105696  ORF Transcript_33946/g.105696 Transcript_33946/m.105696 type:complete len:459 (-) Transcript_33946:474-1850(-)|eukprot:CAMPEP_0175484874 /NCGR_PEP_ID=MMETSP0095-20121207/80222_1 /TAXON_ID=311494 /ORGANISM="Alexandrium monilatum, Strain CCMP3105" /LENGTH=458 /DNA_ID=CAMNT_0016786615 /DNA_START=38 /DNA_END=1414 /DNA_ORIENTATION=-